LQEVSLIKMLPARPLHIPMRKSFPNLKKNRDQVLVAPLVVLQVV